MTRGKCAWPVASEPWGVAQECTELPPCEDVSQSGLSRTTHEIYDKSQMSASMIRDCCNHTQTRFVWRLRLSLSCYREHFIESKPPKFGPRASLGRLLIRAAFLPADDKRSRHTEAKYCLGILTGTHSGPESRGRCRVAAVERATPSVAYVRSTRT